MKEKILLVEDDRDLSRIIQAFLTKEGFDLVVAYDGLEGITLAREEQPQLILLDIMLPEVDGLEVCRNIRTNSIAPIIMISAKNSDMDKMISLGIGADDYLTKPFSLLELGARIKSHLRRFTTFQSVEKNKNRESRESLTTCKVFGNLVIDPVSYKATVEGEKIDFTAREFKLLDFITSNPNQVFSKEQLMNQVWGYAEYIDNNTITVYIGRLREKLSKYNVCYIKTVWGVGYKWEM
ncbi:response regulator transcription factor [Anaerosporobacter faecicola]|uniref:response regulator transcription factor n=1 Tax=Anaerosporobacter faecicola TaxID=2718714 RepID=UPI001EE56952|nr:response regulator transcription factor [Anaerosporobacter faecicola]